MLEQGLVKKFFRPTPTSKRNYGFVHVLDEAGVPTGEELFFHITQVGTLQFNPTTTDFRLRKGWSGSVKAPQKGLVIYFERGLDGQGRPQVKHWIHKSIFDQVSKHYTAGRELSWQIVLKGITYPGAFSWDSSARHDRQEEYISTVLSGTRFASVLEACSWTSTLLDFCDFRDDRFAEDYDDYVYYLEVQMPSKAWFRVRTLTPFPVDEDGRYDSSEEDEDPLAGDIDDGSGYVPGPDPLMTQHYFALQQRGYLE
jgi:hypothetical protein